MKEVKAPMVHPAKVLPLPGALCAAVLCLLLPASQISAADVTIHTTVRVSGQRVDYMVVDTGTPLPDPLPSPDDFTLEGEAYNWMDPTLHSFTAEISDVSADGSSLVLGFEEFPEKYFFVDHFSVTCEGDPSLSFSSGDVTRVVTPVADEFRHVDDDAHDFHYELFTPEDADQPCPAVIVFHGFGDYDNLLTYRTSVEWAEPEQQKVRPCHVISPIIRDYMQTDVRDNVYDCLKGLLDGMIREGAVDPARIYVTGNSFGGAAALEFAERFPHFAAGVIAMCPALNYTGRAVDSLETLADTPVWFAHAEHDAAVPVWASQEAYDTLKKAGNADVHLTVYTDEEMNAAGADPSPEATVSYHHVEAAVMPDDAYKEWLFSHGT